MRKLLKENQKKGELLKEDGRQQLSEMADPAFVCPYCGGNNCEVSIGTDDLNLTYFDRLQGETFNVECWCNDCNKPYNVTVELNVKDVQPSDGDYYQESKRSVNETMQKQWFNEWGWLNKRIPKACIEDCSGPGQKDEAVAYWVEKLHFNIPRDLMEKAKDYLKEFGAWDDTEIDFWAEADAIDHELSKHILWCFCCDIADGNVRSQGELYLGH